MRTFSFLAIALSIANSQFLGFDAVENISCKTDGTTLKTAIAVLTPNPAQIGDKVNIAITAVFSQDETVDSIKLHYIIDLDTIPVSPAVKCAANTPCNVAIDYTVPKILGLGAYDMEAIPMGAGKKEGSATCKINLQEPTTTNMLGGPPLQNCGYEQNYCQLKEASFDPYPFKNKNSDSISFSFNCSRDLTGGKMVAQVSNTSFKTVSFISSAPAGYDFQMKTSGTVTKENYLNPYFQVNLVDKNGSMISCYSGPASINTSDQVEI